MCGIVGFIGDALDRQACFDLTTSLLVKTELRGDDASGYWATNDKNDEGAVVYFSKDALKSSCFVKSDSWKELKGKALTLLIAHCRKSTAKGSENRNRNNHPFTSKDYRTALVHNGNVPEFEALRNEYDIISECDSEILLRMMERGAHYPIDFLKKQLKDLKSGNGKLIKDCKEEEIPGWSHKLLGLCDIFARINYGAMAVAIAEKWANNTRAIWLFRDKERPLHVVDMRESLGQIYVVSDKRIWREAVEALPSLKQYVKGNTPIIEFPANYIWLLTLSPEGKFGVRKFRVNRQRNHSTSFEKERPNLVEPPNDTDSIRVITNLKMSTHEVERSNEAEVVTNTKSTPIPTHMPVGKSSKPKNKSGNGKSVPKLPTDPTDLTGVLDWPENCFDYIVLHIALTSNVKDWIKASLPGDSKSLQEAVTTAGIPDPAVIWKLTDRDHQHAGSHIKKMDCIKWAQVLQSDFGWKARYRNGEPIRLTDLLFEAHEAWVAFIESKHGDFDPNDPSLKHLEDITNWPTKCFAFLAKSIPVISHPSPLWKEDKRITTTLAIDLEKAATDVPIPDPTNPIAELDKEDFESWSKMLQDAFGWCDRVVANKPVELWRLLKDARDTWLTFLDTTNGKAAIQLPPATNANDTNRTSVARSHVNSIFTARINSKDHLAPFVPNPPAGGQYPFSYNNVRTDDMTVNGRKGTIDQVDVDEFHDKVSRIRTSLDNIDTMVGTLFREKTMTKDEFDSLIHSLTDVVNTLESDQFLVGNINRIAQ